MELRHIRYFVKAAELLHFTRAAELLYVSQPTLSSHIQQLEEELGMPLFDRVGRNVELTAAGRIFLPYAQEALRDLELGKEEIANLCGLLSGELNIGMLMTFGEFLMPVWLCGFYDLAPQVRVYVSQGATDFLEAEVEAGRLELILGYSSKNEQLSSVTLFTEELVLAVHKAHPFAARAEVTFADLAELPLAIAGQQIGLRRVFDETVAEVGVKPNIVIEIDDLYSLRTMAATGRFGTLLTRMHVIGHGELIAIPITGDGVKAEYAISWHSQRNLSPAARAFLAHVKAHCCLQDQT